MQNTSTGSSSLQRGLSATFHSGSQVWVPVEVVGRASAKDKRRTVHWRRGVVQVRWLECTISEQACALLRSCRLLLTCQPAILSAEACAAALQTAGRCASATSRRCQKEAGPVPGAHAPDCPSLFDD